MSSSSSSSSTDVDPTVSTTPHPLTLTHLQATALLSVVDLLVQLLPTEATSAAAAAAASSVSSLSSVCTAYHHLHSTIHLLSKASEPGLASENAQAPGLGVWPGRATTSSVVSFTSKEVKMIVDAVDDATRKVKRWRNEVIEDIHQHEPGLGRGNVPATSTARERGRRLVQGPGPAPTHGQGLGQGLESRRWRAKRQGLGLGVDKEEKEEKDAVTEQISSSRDNEPKEKDNDKGKDQQSGQDKRQGQDSWAKENEEDRQVTWRLCGVLSSTPTTSTTSSATTATTSSSHRMMTGAISTQGYTCGLWSLLHFFTVASGQQQQQQQQQDPGHTHATTTGSRNTTALTTTTTVNTVDVLGLIRALVDQVGHHDKSTDDDNFTITINDTKDDDTPPIYTVQYICNVAINSYTPPHIYFPHYPLPCLLTLILQLFACTECRSNFLATFDSCQYGRCDIGRDFENMQYWLFEVRHREVP